MKYVRLFFLGTALASTLKRRLPKWFKSKAAATARFI